MSYNEISVLKASNLLESGEFQKAFDSLTVIIPRIISEKLKAEAYLYISDAEFELGANEESIESGIKASNFENDEETWIKPFAYYYTARAYFKLGNTKNAENFLEKAEDFNDYDYQTKLTALINSLKFKLPSKD